MSQESTIIDLKNAFQMLKKTLDCDVLEYIQTTPCKNSSGVVSYDGGNDDCIVTDTFEYISCSYKLDDGTKGEFTTIADSDRLLKKYSWHDRFDLTCCKADDGNIHCTSFERAFEFEIDVQQNTVENGAFFGMDGMSKRLQNIASLFRGEDFWKPSSY